MADIKLYNSMICRLCAEDNENGELLFTYDSEETERSAMINRYLPLKVHDDGKLPCSICPGCNIQLEATAQFFELIMNGQRKIKQMWKEQVLKENNKHSDEKNVDASLLNNTKELFNKNFATVNDLPLLFEDPDKSKKKRGRPPKFLLEEEIQEASKNTVCEKINESEYKEKEESENDKKERRKIKVPKRYLETLQGKELEKVFKEEGVLDDKNFIKCEPFENYLFLDKESSNNDSDVIGHIINSNGKDSNKPVAIKNCNRTNQIKKVKKKKFICTFCGKDFLQRSKYITHKTLHKKTKGHTKENLAETNETHKNSEIELKKIYTDHTTEKCNIFIAKENYKTKKVETEQKNMIQCESTIEFNSTKNVFKCDKCTKQFKSVNNLDAHIKAVHQGEKPHQCKLCNKTFAYQTSLQGHIEIEHLDNLDKGFPCNLCGKIFNHPSSVNYHKLTEHNDGRLHECNKCSKRFKHKQLLHRHQLVHSENRPYQCESCTASFKTKANLLNHQSTHTGEKKHCCEVCNAKFAHKTSLTLHYRTHTGQKPYKCEVCAKCFSQNGNLQEHMRIHTGEKPYCCDHCGRKFTTSSQFKLHVKRHTGERPWKCDYCSKSFLDKDSWKCHLRRHTGERPFECATCHRKFTEQWALKKHLRLHTGEKPYKCDVCGKAFADCSNLTKHKKVHKKKSIWKSTKTSSIKTENELWQITQNSVEENLKTEKLNQISSANEIPENEVPQNIYLSYPHQSNFTETVTLKISEDNLITDQSSSDELENNQNTDNVDDNDIHLSILDSDGNSIRLSIEQARQLLSEGHFLNQQNQETNQPTVLNNMKVDPSSNTIQENILKSPTQAKLQTDDEEIVEILQDRHNDTTSVAVSQINTREPVRLSNQQVFQLIIPGQKLQLFSGLLSIV